LDYPERTKRFVKKEKRNLEKNGEKQAAKHLRRAPARLPSASSAAGRLLLLSAIGSSSELLWMGKRMTWAGKNLEDEELGENCGLPGCLFIEPAEEIVVGDRGAHPKISEGGKPHEPSSCRVVWDSCRIGFGSTELDSAVLC